MVVRVSLKRADDIQVYGILEVAKREYELFMQRVALKKAETDAFKRKFEQKGVFQKTKEFLAGKR